MMTNNIPGLNNAQIYPIVSNDQKIKVLLKRKPTLGKKRSPSEDKEMERLSDELSDLGFAKDFKDPYYAMFVQKMALHTKFHQEILSPEEQKEQDAIADSIIAEILKEDASK